MNLIYSYSKGADSIDIANQLQNLLVLSLGRFKKSGAHAFPH